MKILKMNRQLRYTGLIIVAILMVFIGIGSSDRAGEPEYQPRETQAGSDTDMVVQKVVVPPLKDEYLFAGERIPIENPDVRERLQRELIVNTHYHSASLLNLLRSKRYFEEIDIMLREKGIPTDFKYVAVAESNLEYVTSPAGARGIWQIMPAVARHYGLEVNSAIDERNHFEKSTYAACGLIADYYKRFGNWISTAAAYNAGENRIARNMKEQGSDNYFDLNLNVETSRYIFRIIAMKEILENPEYYGFYVDENIRYEPLSEYRIVEVDNTIDNLGAFAAEHGISYRELKIYNPWMLTDKLPDKTRKVYQIKIPLKSYKTK